jgi:hypothetical protein
VYAALPLSHSVFHLLALGSLHRDQLALERAVAHVSGGAWFDATNAHHTDKLIPGD